MPPIALRPAMPPIALRPAMPPIALRPAMPPICAAMPPIALRPAMPPIALRPAMPPICAAMPPGYGFDEEADGGEAFRGFRGGAEDQADGPAAFGGQLQLAGSALVELGQRGDDDAYGRTAQRLIDGPERRAIVGRADDDQPLERHAAAGGFRWVKIPQGVDENDEPGFAVIKEGRRNQASPLTKGGLRGVPAGLRRA